MGDSLCRLTRLRVLLFVLATLLASWSPAAPARAEGVFVGACTLELQVTFSSPLSVIPAPMSMSLAGGGTCVVNGVVAPMRMAGALATTALSGGFGCAGGIVTGSGAVEVDIEGFPGPPVTLAVVSTGEAVTLVALNTAPSLLRFEGAGALVTDPVDVVACPSGSVTSTTWTGTFAFQDPEPSPV